MFPYDHVLIDGTLYQIWSDVFDNLYVWDGAQFRPLPYTPPAAPVVPPPLPQPNRQRDIILGILGSLALIALIVALVLAFVHTDNANNRADTATAQKTQIAKLAGANQKLTAQNQQLTAEANQVKTATAAAACDVSHAYGDGRSSRDRNAKCKGFSYNAAFKQGRAYRERYICTGHKGEDDYLKGKYDPSCAGSDRYFYELFPNLRPSR